MPLFPSVNPGSRWIGGDVDDDGGEEGSGGDIWRTGFFNDKDLFVKNDLVEARLGVIRGWWKNAEFESVRRDTAHR